MSPGSDRYLGCSETFAQGEGREGLRAGGKALRVASRELLDNHFELARGEDRPSDSIEFVPDSGGTPHDLIGTTYASLVLVSERYVSVLREHRFTGWATFSVTVFIEDAQELAGYHGFAVTGRAGAIDDSLSERIELPPPVPGGISVPGLRGLCFQPDSWDGSDVFTPDDSARIFVVEQVKRALEQASISNVEFRRASEIERTWRADGSLLED